MCLVRGFQNILSEGEKGDLHKLMRQIDETLRCKGKRKQSEDRTTWEREHARLRLQGRKKEHILKLKRQQNVKAGKVNIRRQERKCYDSPRLRRQQNLKQGGK